MPPAALVRIAARTPMRANTRIGNTTLLHRISFIKMDAPLHHHHRPLANIAHHQLACVSNGGGARKMWDIVVADADSLRHLVGKSAQPRPQHDRHQSV